MVCVESIGGEASDGFLCRICELCMLKLSWMSRKYFLGQKRKFRVSTISFCDRPPQEQQDEWEKYNKGAPSFTYFWLRMRGNCYWFSFGPSSSSFRRVFVERMRENGR